MTRRKRRALLVLTAASAAVAAMSMSIPSRYAAHREWEKGLAAAADDDVVAAEAAFKRCMELRPSDKECAAVHQIAFLASRANSFDLGWRRPASLERSNPETPGGPASELAASPAPAAAQAGPTEDDMRRAIKHWNEGIKYFQKNEPSKARDEWLLCKKFDPNNTECVEGLVRIDRAYGGGQ